MQRLSAKFFSDAELRCKCCGLLILDPVFDKELLRLRVRFDQPIHPSSCCRCKKHNAEVIGKPRSFHIGDKPAWKKLIGTAAIDVKYTSIFCRNKLARTAWEMGWRVGLHKKFLHLDCAHIIGILPQSIFRYEQTVTEQELEKFKSIIIGD